MRRSALTAAARNAGPAALAEYRERRAAEKRRQRARYRAAGLNSDGRPLVRPANAHYAHPTGCRCYDCLWAGLPELPRTYRVRGRRT